MHIFSVVLFTFRLRWVSTMKTKFTGVRAANDRITQAPPETKSDNPSSAITKPLVKIKKKAKPKYRHKPTAGSVGIQEEIKQHRAAVVSGMVKESSKRKGISELKAALREQLKENEADERPYYNAEVYRLAIRTMTVSDAFRLAKDETNALTYLVTQKALREALETAPEPVPVLTKQDVKHTARFQDRIIRTRTNQSDFSCRVAVNFKGVCAITGSGEGLQAAHIDPIASGNNNTSNGIYLLSCLHWMFDNGYMAIHPESLTVHFATSCTWFAKEQFEGKTLRVHNVPLNKSGLSTVWESFSITNIPNFREI
jgi:hypothetical protein